MSRKYSTRALVRETFPFVLADGRNPTVSEIKSRVRQIYTELKDWNPSDATVFDEIKKIRAELGASLLARQALPGLPESVSNALAGAGARIMEVARSAAEEALKGDRDRMSEENEQAGRCVEEAQQALARAESTLASEHQRFDVTVARLEAERDAARQSEAVCATQVSLLQDKIERLAAGVEEKTSEITVLTAKLDTRTQQFSEQLVLAETRYRDLEKAKLNELDQARTQRYRAIREAEDWKKNLEATRKEAAGVARELAKMRETLDRSLRVATGRRATTKTKLRNPPSK